MHEGVGGEDVSNGLTPAPFSDVVTVGYWSDKHLSHDAMLLSTARHSNPHPPICLGLWSHHLLSRQKSQVLTYKPTAEQSLLLAIPQQASFHLPQWQMTFPATTTNKLKMLEYLDSQEKESESNLHTVEDNQGEISS